MRIRQAGMAAALLSAILIAPCSAQSGAEALAYRIKAAFVCKFANYVEWPPQVFAGADSPIVIGVVATDLVVDELVRTAVGLSAEGRPLVVRKLNRGDPVTSAHIVYITRSAEERLAETLAAARGHSVLTVTESEGAPTGMINFVLVENKVRFDISPQAAEASRLRISARLLGVARRAP